MRDGTITRRVVLAGTVLALGGAAGMAPLGASPAGAGTGRATTEASAARDLLHLSAFPSGWTSSPNGGSGDSQAVAAREIAACVGTPPREIAADPPGATSPEFDRTAQGLSVDEEVQVFPTTTSAARAFGVLDDADAPGCAAAYLDRTTSTGTGGSAGGGTAGRYSVLRLPFPSYGEPSTALSLSLPVTGHGHTLTTDVDDVVVLAGRTEATLTLTSLGSPFPAGLARRLVSAASRRIG